MRGIVRTTVLAGALGMAALAPGTLSAAHAAPAKPASEWRPHTYSNLLVCMANRNWYADRGYLTEPPPPERCVSADTSPNYFYFWHFQP